MTDYNTMTAQQCADWLAERERWEPPYSTGPYSGGWRRDIPERREYEYRDDHPFPMTLDAAAAALREPWRLVSLQVNSVGWAFVKAYNPSVGWMELVAPDRLTAEYRAAVAARMEDDK